MSPILGRDYGQTVIGIALATTPLAEPWLILDNNDQLITKLVSLCHQHHITTIIVGLSNRKLFEKTHLEIYCFLSKNQDFFAIW